MVSRDEFRAAARLAVQNVIKHGDTDIFPFPFETHAFFDRTDDIIDVIVEYDDNFEEFLARFPPRNVNSLTPVSYEGFRWATQIDPIWNAHLLTCVLALSSRIESARIPKETNTVFSYRYQPDPVSGDLFDRNFGWVQFMEHSTALSTEYDFVVACDISEFYPRLGHHRLENALKQVAGETPFPKRIMDFLSNFSNQRSFGLPVGGPAARILSEITINQVDRLLFGTGIIFARFADDYHLFARSREDSYRHLFFLSEKLFDNQGLSLQKSKTRIMTGAEFRATSPLKRRDDGVAIETTDGRPPVLEHGSAMLLRFSLRFDPYSKNAHEDYEKLKEEVSKFDIIGLLKEELSKSRIHTALARKIISAIRYLDSTRRDEDAPSIRDAAVLSILASFEVLYPIISSVLMMFDAVFEEIHPDTQAEVIKRLHTLIASESHIFRVDVHLAYALRVLAKVHRPETQLLFQRLYENRTSPLIRRDIILAMARWGEWYWISDLRNRFRELSGPERRAFIVASYILKDEGAHWRKHINDELNPFEAFIRNWAADKVGRGGWIIPL
jgi:hypothetical protein